MRGSCDGFKGQTFLDKCSKKGKTVILIKDTNNKIFGGYTDLDWGVKEEWICNGNKNSFLFSFNIDKRIVKCKCLNNSHEIFGGSLSWITLFGNTSLRICSDCNLNSNSYSLLYNDYYES